MGQPLAGQPPKVADDDIKDGIEEAIWRVIATMHEKLGETLTIDDLARAAMYSKFHFSRAFQRATGVSPGRFLSAMRLQEAKRLLISTTLTVTEISHLVGYSSVGTFGSRFCNTVGMAPTVYRRRRGVRSWIPTDKRRVPTASNRATVHGAVRSTVGHEDDTVFVGLFREPIPQGTPVSCVVLRSPGPYELTDVPPGTWYLLAQSVSREDQRPSTDQEVSVGANGPIVVGAGAAVAPVNVQLRPMRALDPPVLMALLDARTAALEMATAS